MTVFLRALTRGEYSTDYSTYAVPAGYERCDDLNEALDRLTRIPERWSHWWDILWVEDTNGRILARKERWEAIQVRYEGWWMTLDEYQKLRAEERVDWEDTP